MSQPIGVFDSGVGGLSVLREIRRLLPAEDFIYIAYSGNVPYGNKTSEFIQARGRVLTRFLLAHGCKAIVIACNTATASAAAALRQEFPEVPIVGMEPAVKPAVAATKNGVVGVFATVGMLQSAQIAALLDRFATNVQVILQPCPGLVERVEAGDLDSPKTRELVQNFLTPIQQQNADTLVLGCTHYPFLRPIIQELAGPQLTLIETGPAVAKQLHRRLVERNLLATRPGDGTETFYTTGDLAKSQIVIRRLWRPDATVLSLPPSTD